jgi:hypothetical protein
MHGKTAWWTQAVRGHTMFHGAGRSGNIETTAMATLALLAAKSEPVVVRGALLWLMQQKDSQGTWHSTQATVLALKALLAGTGSTLPTNKQRHIDILLDDALVHEIVVEPEQADVVRQFILPKIRAGKTHRLKVREQGDGGAGYQIIFRQYVDLVDREIENKPLSIAIDYDRTSLSVSDVVSATATVHNNLNTTAPMVILDLPIPAGFSVTGDDFEQALEQSKIAKYETTQRSMVIYLRAMQPGEEFQIQYRLRATMPVKVTAPAPAAYLYYDPDQRAEGKPEQLLVKG